MNPRKGLQPGGPLWGRWDLPSKRHHLCHVAPRET
jgi:hypothetical protein